MLDINFDQFARTWIIAEIGVNHEGDIHKAIDMIQLAAEVGVDAVKFQTYKAERYVSSIQPERLARVKRFELSYEDFEKLAQEAESNGVVFFSTPLHPDDCQFRIHPDDAEPGIRTNARRPVPVRGERRACGVSRTVCRSGKVPLAERAKRTEPVHVGQVCNLPVNQKRGALQKRPVDAAHWENLS